MSSRADRIAGAVVGAVVAIAVIMPLSALSGISRTDQPAPATQVAAAPAAPEEPAVLEQKAGRKAGAKGATYSLRCWQYGRLVFEETGVRVDFEGEGQQTRLRGTDRSGDPLVITDTRNATCLIRSERQEPTRPPR